MKNCSYILGFVGIVILLSTSLVFSQVTTSGKIVGRIIDKATGEPLIGATVQVVDQQRLGSATDVDGEYFILNVPVGTYSLKTAFIGYRGVIAQNVYVSAGYTTTQNFDLTPEPVEMGEIVVRAERPLVQPDQTNTTAIMTAEEIRNIPLRGVEGVVAIQTGVVTGRGTDNTTFYTRGGRANETILYVDGFEQNNLLTGEATVSINQQAIQEVQTQTGGFNAEYGRALSGVINVVTKEAASKYKANVEVESDFFMGKTSRGYNIYNLSLSGPLIGYDPITFFVTGELRNLATARGTLGTVGDVNRSGKIQEWDKGYLPNDRNDGYTLQGKLTYHLTSTAQLNVNFLHSNFQTQNYFDILKYNLDHAWWNKDNNTTISGVLTYTFSSSTYLEVSGAYFNTRHFSGDGLFRDNFNLYQTVGQDNPRNLYDPARGGYFFPAGWEQFQGNVSADTTLIGAYLDANGLRPYYISSDRYDPYGLYFAPGYARRYYQTYHTQYYNPKLSVVSQINAYNQIKIGAEYRYHSLSYYENFEADRGVNATLINAFGYTDNANETENGSGGLLDKTRHPWDIAIYAQDKIESEGLIVNLGVRFDFFNANTKSLKDERDPLGANQVPSGDPRQRKADASDFSDTKTENQISPRLGIAFPISERTVFHFNYGKFFQQSNLTDLYYGTSFIEYKAYNGSPAIAVQNPNLRPEETTSYEVGITNQIADNMRLMATAYYKDTKNLINIHYTGTNAPGGAALYLVSNMDYGTIKGVDLALEARRLGWISGRLAYSLAFADGTGSASRENFNAAWLGYETAKFTTPLAYDQRHTVSANIDIRNETRREDFLDRVGLNMLFLARSGFPYTPTEKYNAAASNISVSVPKDAPIGGVNTEYGPWTFRIDAKLDKEFDLGPVNVDLYIRVLNLLNTKNVFGVYQGTGNAYSDGYLGTSLGADQARLYEYMILKHIPPAQIFINNITHV